MLRILPDKEGHKGIDVLTGKGKLADYQADYQKVMLTLAFEAHRIFCGEKKGRLGVSLSHRGVGCASEERV